MTHNDFIKLMGRLIIAVSGVLGVLPPSILAAPPASSQLASDSESLDAFYRERLSNATANEINRCRRSEDVGLALQATWELVKREAVPHFDDNEEGYVRLTTLDSAHRFIGFVEGKLNVDVPDWWVNAFLGANLDSDSSLYNQWKFLIDETESRPADLPSYYRLVEELHWVADDDESDDIGTLNAIEMGGKDVHLPATIIDLCRKHPQSWRLTGTTSEEAAFIAVFDERWGYGSVRLCCFSGPDRKHRWTADVWSEPPEGYGGTGLGPTHYVQIVIDDKAAYVFGFDEVTAYIEAFSIASGDPLFRFGTQYATPEE